MATSISLSCFDVRTRTSYALGSALPCAEGTFAARHGYGPIRAKAGEHDARRLEVMAMAQQGQVFPLAVRGRNRARCAYRYRAGGRGSKRLQRGGFESQRAAAEALERVLGQLRREQGLVESPTLAELVDAYLAQHEGEAETTEKLRWLLAKAVCAFGERSLPQLRSPATSAVSRP